MSNEKLVCPICGEPTRVYMGNARKDRLCGKHADMLKAGELIIDEKGHYVKTSVKSKREDDLPDWLKDKNESKTIIKELPKQDKNDDKVLLGDTACCVCGEPSNGKPQCKNCYYESLDFMETLDKNNNVRKLRDHYYNLKERIFIIKTLEEAQRQCNRLIAIAMLANNIYSDTSLLDRAYKDVEALLKGKQAPQMNSTHEEERKENDATKSKVNTAQDGHTVDSDMEVRIDDILYNACILHCYGKNIDEITEKRKKCDWFIPIVNGEGIYIEYWGMKTPKYLEERAEKEELYKKHNIPYIGIETDDPKKDTLTFRSNLIRDLTKLAEERYGFMPKWKK